MAFRSGIYMVPTDRWYIERTVWVIAGLCLLAFSGLAVLDRPLWAVAIIALAMVSINVSLTGFCPIGNLLLRLGFRPRLGRADTRPGLYLMQTDAWYLERRIYMGVGINLTVATVLALAHSPWWLLFPAFVGVAMLVFAGTGFCIMANSLYWMGAEPRLAPRCPAGEPDSTTVGTSRAA